VRAHEDHVPEPAPSGGTGLFEPPPPGTYELPAIRRVPERQLLASDGSAAELPGLEPGQVGVVSFIYRSCADAGGCPLALSVMRRLDREVAASPELASRVRLVTVSFDPERDTPAKMAELRAALEPRGDWRFLTGPDVATIAPVLVDYDQDVLLDTVADGEAPVFRHLLRLFLVDDRGNVRNVYSSSLLDWRVLRNDVVTVLDEEAARVSR
jgi:cytochrome oxidase Cu insertion factor (SCO1/SenC/PrrC family)